MMRIVSYIMKFFYNMMKFFYNMMKFFYNMMKFFYYIMKFFEYMMKIFNYIDEYNKINDEISIIYHSKIGNYIIRYMKYIQFFCCASIFEKEYFNSKYLTKFSIGYILNTIENSITEKFIQKQKYFDI